MRLKLLMIFMMLLLSSIVAAEYPYTGYDSFNMDNGFLNPSADLENTGAAGLNDGKYQALTADINSDNVTEVIVLDGTIIKIFSGYTLDVFDAISLPELDGRGYSPIYIYDIDSDGYPNIMIASNYRPFSETGYILSYEYNGTEFIQDFNHSIPETGSEFTSTYNTIISCGGGKCVVYSSYDNYRIGSTGSGISILFASAFDESDIGGPEAVKYYFLLQPYDN